MKKLLAVTTPLALTLLVNAAYAGCTQSKVTMYVQENTTNIQQAVPAWQENHSPAAAADYKPQSAISTSPSSGQPSQQSPSNATSSSSVPAANQTTFTIINRQQPQPVAQQTMVVTTTLQIMRSAASAVTNQPTLANIAQHPVASAASAQAVAEEQITAFILSDQDCEDYYNHGIQCYNKSEFADAKRLFYLAASHGHAYAQYRLGKRALYPGWFKTPNHQEALDWITQAAQQGVIEAQELLANMYHNGIGTNVDDKQAIVWHTKAAEQGSAGAQFSLSAIYRKSDNPDDINKADYLLRQAANAGMPAAQYCLGSICENNARLASSHTENFAHMNCPEAIEWYQKAAAQGFVDAQSALGRCYETGECVEKNLEQAQYWHQQAAASGQPYAQRDCGIFYAHQFDEKNAQAHLAQAYKKKDFFGNPSQRILDELTTQADCPICYEPMTLGDKQHALARATCCNHLFHDTCLYYAMNQYNKCPLCNTKDPYIATHTEI